MAFRGLTFPGTECPVPDVGNDYFDDLFHIGALLPRRLSMQSDRTISYVHLTASSFRDEIRGPFLLTWVDINPSMKK